MKKVLYLFILPLALCLTGCGDKLTKCVSNEKDDFVNYEYKIYSKGDEVTKIIEKVTYEFENEKEAKEVMDSPERPEFDADDVEFKRDGKIITAVATYNVENAAEKTSKKELVESIESDNFTCK